MKQVNPHTQSRPHTRTDAINQTKSIPPIPIDRTTRARARERRPKGARSSPPPPLSLSLSESEETTMTPPPAPTGVYAWVMHAIRRLLCESAVWTIMKCVGATTQGEGRGGGLPSFLLLLLSSLSPLPLTRASLSPPSSPALLSPNSRPQPDLHVRQAARRRAAAREFFLRLIDGLCRGARRRASATGVGRVRARQPLPPLR
jgi:hypothetical protein